MAFNNYMTPLCYDLPPPDWSRLPISRSFFFLGVPVCLYVSYPRQVGDCLNQIGQLNLPGHLFQPSLMLLKSN